MDLAQMVAKFREMLGAGEDLTEENLLSRIQERFEASATEKVELEKRLTDLEGQLAAAADKPEASKAPVVDEEMLDDRAEAIADKTAALVQAGKLNEAAAKELVPVLCGVQGKRPAYCLSRKVSGTEQSVAKSILAALSKNSLPDLAKMTGHQLTELSRTVPGTETDEAEQVATTKRMTEQANAGRGEQK